MEKLKHRTGMAGRMDDGWVQFAGFFLLFAVLFIAYPLQGQFTGKSDSIGHITIFYEHYYRVLEFFGSSSFGNIYYPERGILPYTEFYLGESIVFFTFRLIGFPDVWAAYLLVVTICALNGFAVSRLTYFYTKHGEAAFLAGLFFSASCLMTGHTELLNGLSFFCIPLALLFLEKAIRHQDPLHLYSSAAILAVTSYFSTYHYVFGLLLLLGFALMNAGRIGSVGARPAVLALLLLLLVALPSLIKLYGFIEVEKVDVADILHMDYKVQSFKLRNFVFIFQDQLSGLAQDANESRKLIRPIVYHTQFGLVFTVLAAIGLLARWREKAGYIVVLLLVSFLALGPYVSLGKYQLKLPLHYLYQFEFAQALFRHPGRIFIFGAFILSMFAGFGWMRVNALLARGSILMVCLASLVFLVENGQVNRFRISPPQVPPTHYPEWYDRLRAYDPKDLVIAEFPSSLFTTAISDGGLTSMPREYYYQYWQTIHRQSTVNGSSSYYPPSRLYNDSLMANITEGNNLSKLIDDNKIDYLHFHFDLILEPSDREVIDLFRNSTKLELVEETDAMAVYKVMQ